MQKLGRIEAVDLRSIWPSEDSDFTPWLAQKENLEMMGPAPINARWRQLALVAHLRTFA